MKYAENFRHITGSGMWVDGDRGATPCYVDTIGVLSHGIRIIQAKSKCQPKKPVKPVLHFSRASFSRKHGIEVETN